MTDTVTKINPDTLPDAGALGYSQVTTCEPGKLVFLSGQVAWTRDGGEVPSDMAGQAAIAFDNVKKALASVDATPDNVTSMRLYVVNLSPDNMAAAGGPLGAFFGGQAPCVTAIGVTSLAAPELLIEIEVVAAE